MRENKFIRIFIAVLAIYAVLGFFILPMVLKPQIEKVINQNITKTATIQNIAFNPFTFMLKVKGFKISDKNEDIISFREFYVDFSLLKSLHKLHLNFKKVTLVDAKINIVEDDKGVINLTTLAKKSANKQEEQKDSEEGGMPINFKVLKTVFENATITYKKLDPIDPFAVSIDKLNYTFYDFGSFKNSLASHSFKTYINKNTKLEINGGLRLEPFTMYANVSLQNLKPAQYLQYKKDMLNFTLNEQATLNLDFGYQVDMKKGLRLKVQNLNLKAHHFDMMQRDKSILKFKDFALENLNLEYPAQTVGIDSILLDALDTNIITSKTGVLNLADLVKQNEEAQESTPSVKASSSKPWRVNLKEFDLSNAKVSYEDFKTNNFVKTNNINLDINAVNLIGADAKVKTIKLAKPSVSYKNTKLKLAVDTKEFELNINNVEKKAEKISVEAVNFVQQNMKFKDDKNRLALQSKKLSLALNNIVKEKENINIQTLNLSEPNISFKDSKNGIAVQTKDKKVAASEIQVIGSKVLAKAITINEPNISYKNSTSKDNVQVKNTKVNISNLKVDGQNIAVDKIAIAKPDIRYKNSKAKLDVKTDDLKVELRGLNKKGNNISVAKLKVLEPKVNIKDNKTLKYINIKGVALNLDKVSYKNSIASIKKLSFKKKAMNFEDKLTKNKIESKNINLAVNSLKYANNTLAIKSSSLNKPYIGITLPRKPKFEKKEEDKKEEVKKATPKPKVKKIKKKDDFKMEIGPFKIKEAKLSFEDRNLPIAFKTLVSSLNGDFSEFSSTSSKPTKLNLEGKVDQYGYTKITGFVEHEDIKELTDVTLLFKNIAIKNFTPYSGKFIGREIESGKLNLNLKYNIKRSNLDASNSIIISDIKLGKNVDSPDAVSLPLELAIALLEDSNGVIDLELPITGNVDDPKFSIAPIVWKVFTNLIVKAISSPFTLLASMLGIEEDEIKSIEFEYASSAILASEKEALDNIAKILVKRPKLGIKVHPTYDTTNDVKVIQEQRTDKLIDAKMKTIKDKKVDKYKVALEGIYLTYKDQKPLEELQKAFTKKEKDKKPVFESEKYLEKIKEIIQGKQVVTKEQLVELTNKRVESIKTYLTTQKGVEPKKLTTSEIKEVQKSKNFTKFDLEVEVSK